MTDYILHISSFEGIVSGACHYRGRVEGPHPDSCHGALHYNAPGHRGQSTCDEGHVIPEQVTWTVEAAWTEEQYERWAARHFDGPGPEQFSSEQEVIDTAVARFLGQLPAREWENPAVTPGGPGDRLWAGWVSRPQNQDLVEENWGTVLTEVPVREVTR